MGATTGATAAEAAQGLENLLQSPIREEEEETAEAGSKANGALIDFVD